MSEIPPRISMIAADVIALNTPDKAHEQANCAVGDGSADWARIDKLKAEIKEIDHQRKLRESEINGILIARMTRARYRQPNTEV